MADLAHADLSASAVMALDPRLSDEEIVRRIRAGECTLYAVLLKRHNQRLFRAARSILRRDDEAEDAVQQAWVAAYEKLDQFRGDAALATWLTRIAVNEALGRVRTRTRNGDLEIVRSTDDVEAVDDDANPEEDMAAREIGVWLERAIDSLPQIYRVVFVLREVEEMDTAGTAACLGVSEQTVRVRLHRARLLLQEALADVLGSAATQVFRFDGARCHRISRRVLGQLSIAVEP